MAEIETKVKFRLIHFCCEECHIGNLIATDTTLTVDPPLYPHKCNACEEVTNLNRTYPYLRCEDKRDCTKYAITAHKEERGPKYDMDQTGDWVKDAN